VFAEGERGCIPAVAAAHRLERVLGGGKVENWRKLRESVGSVVVDSLVVEAEDGDGLIVALLLGAGGGDGHQG
jgi:hypothetical protein